MTEGVAKELAMKYLAASWSIAYVRWGAPFPPAPVYTVSIRPANELIECKTHQQPRPQPLVSPYPKQPEHLSGF